MSTDFIESLDTALEHLRKKEPIANILKRYPEEAEDLASLLQAAEALNSVQAVEMPSLDVMQADRTEFLANIEKIGAPSVSPGLYMRLIGWMGSLMPQSNQSHPPKRKENQKMNVVFARVMLVFVLLFGAAGGAYAMADNSLPDSPLYAAKLAMEQIQLRMASAPDEIAMQHMAMAKNRVRVILRTVQTGNAPDTAVMTQLENHLNLALQYAAQLNNDGEMQGLLARIRSVLQEQTRVLTQTQASVAGSAGESLQMALQLMNMAQNQVEAGLQDPNTFRWQFTNGFQIGEPDSEQSGDNFDCPNCPCVDCDGDQNRNRNGTQSDPPAPGGQGGDQDCPNCPCVDCDGDQNRNQEQNREQNQEQNQEQNSNGTQSDQPDSGGQGGGQDCPNCPCADCDGDPDQDRTRDRDRDQSCDGAQAGQGGSNGSNGN